MADSQAISVLGDTVYDDPSQLSQLLRQRAGSANLFHFTTSPESHQHGGTVIASILSFSPRSIRVAPPPIQFIAAPLQPSINTSPRRVEHVNYVKPSLPTYYSAPTESDTVRKKDCGAKMHRTFAGVDAPGDTQPDSQFNKTSSNDALVGKENILVLGPRSLFVEHKSEDSNNEVSTDELSESDAEDGSGSSSQHDNTTTTRPAAITMHDSAYIEENSIALTSPLKFETPFARRKRSHLGQVMSSEARSSVTPGTVVSVSVFGAAFGNGAMDGVTTMSLTQAWHNTQAPTSPAVDGVNEDAVFERPSPNFTNLRQSSPIPAYSSPIKEVRPEHPRTDPILEYFSGPRVEYVTMKQSQEERKLSTASQEPGSMDEDSWNELERKHGAEKARQRTNYQAARSLSSVTAPKIQSRNNRRHRTKFNLAATSNKHRAEAKGDHRDQHSLNQLSQRVAAEHDGRSSEDEMFGNKSSRLDVVRQHMVHDIQVPKTSSNPHISPNSSQEPSVAATPSQQIQEESQLRTPVSQQLSKDVVSGTKDVVTIMDSQPDTTAKSDSISHKTLRFFSSPSTNQYSIYQTTMNVTTGYTSQALSSSIPPLPPRSSAEHFDTAQEAETLNQEEERVPSSPPLLSIEGNRIHDDDISNNVQTYDEYAEAILDETEEANEEGDFPMARSALAERETHEVKFEDDGDTEAGAVQSPEAELGSDKEVPQASDMVPLLQNKVTLPESVLEETQSSVRYRNEPSVASEGSQKTSLDTTCVDNFETIQDEDSTRTNEIAPLSSKEVGSDSIHAHDRIRSISDVQNLPETQLSHNEEQIDMPRLSSLNEEREDDFQEPGLDTSPRRPAKRRKITYSAKHKTFHSPIQPNRSSEIPGHASHLTPAQDVAELVASEEQRTKETVSERGTDRRTARLAIERISGLRNGVKSKVGENEAPQPISRQVPKAMTLFDGSPQKPMLPKEDRSYPSTTPTNSRAQSLNKYTEVGMLNTDEDDAMPVDPTSLPDDTEIRRAVFKGDKTTSVEILLPNRVFALWPGSHYYPATCLGRATLQQLNIRFDDGNTTSMEGVHVRALDLRAGDQVKVNEPGLKKKTYVIVGLKDRIDGLASAGFPVTDRLGFSTVELEAKQRESLPANKIAQPAENISVPISSLYLTAGLWTRLRDRVFNFANPESSAKSASRIGTPTRDIVEPLSFSRRGVAIPSFLKDVKARTTSVASTARTISGAFSNMAFVLTSTAADIDKDAIAKTIRSNGGLVLEHGLHELFEYETEDIRPSQERRRSISIVDDVVGLALKPAHWDLGFVALISDSYSRSTKYIQALALNIPCLHHRWIKDSLTASRPLPFPKYLLPAGVSKFLDPNGVIRSRTLDLYDPSGEVNFAQTIAARDLLLAGQSVLLVTGRSKKEIEKRQPFVFLTHALGAATVGRCADLAAANQMLKHEQWNWVYVDNSEASLAEAAGELLGTNKPPSTTAAKSKKGKKRRRDESEEDELLLKGMVAGKQVRITCAEFVIQSLILGALVEE